jgi:transcriptional regulator EpsA
MHECLVAQHWTWRRLSRSSYKHITAFPTRTKTRVFLHWRPAGSLTFTRNSAPKFNLMNATRTVPGIDPAQFLKIAGQGAGISSHAELWRWLQGDVQQWLAHDAMLIGWGDFRAGQLQFDIVSSLPGLRSHHWTAAALAPLIHYFRDCWVAAQQLPCQPDVAGCTDLLRSAARGWAPVEAIGAMRAALVHGTSNGDGAGERIFAALSKQPLVPGCGTALKLLLPFIDTALRRVPPAPASCATREPRHLVGGAHATALSERERQIMRWVALGKTNPEIGCILHISEFTVKNHMKSIFGKLDVSNRAQAVAKLTRVTVDA